MNKIVVGLAIGLAVGLVAHARPVPAPVEPAAHVKVPGAGYHLVNQCCSTGAGQPTKPTTTERVNYGYTTSHTNAKGQNTSTYHPTKVTVTTRK